MNRKLVIYTISRIMVMEALLLVLPLCVSLFYNESPRVTYGFIYSILLILVVFFPNLIKKPKYDNISTKDGLVSVSLAWVMMCLFGALPFYFSGEVEGFINCILESTSGLSTTGSTIIRDLNAISNSLLFWRSFTLYIGGMGVLVLFLAVFPEISSGSVHIMKAEVPGPQFGKLVSKIRDAARVLYFIYLGMTAVLILVLIMAGMPTFDAILHGFSTAGTGGFGARNSTIQIYNSTLIEIILAVFMLLFGINFNLYYYVILGRFKDAIKSEELRAYGIVVLLSSILICYNISPNFDTLQIALKEEFFTVSSVITSTGFVTSDYGEWPVFSKWILMSLMFIGACAGSTAGGIKLSRVIIILKVALNNIKKTLSPRRTVSVNFEGKKVDDNTVRVIVNYLIVFCILFALFMTIVSINAPDFKSAFSAVAASINNIGPGLGVVGPYYNYADMSSLSKLTLSIAMLFGRLELIPMLILFMPATWRKT